MATRTVPNLFPLLFVNESFTRKVTKASLFRKFAMGQNYLWSRLRRIYAMGGVEGWGNRIFHLNSDFQYSAGGGARLGAEDTPVGDVNTPNGVIKGIPLVTFLVPPNWCGSQRVQVQLTYNFKTTNGSVGYLIASLQRLDGTFVADASVELDTTDETNRVDALVVDVPQDDVYQIKVYMAFVDGSTSTENSFTGEYLEVKHVSARYANASAAEMGGDTPPDEWQPLADFFTQDLPVASVFLKKLTENLQHLYAYRPPELCQTYLGKPNHNTSTFTEVGRYILWTPSMVTKWKGKLIIYCTHSGAGNEVRVLVDGVVKETFTALSAGENLKDIAEITVTDNAEHTLTIEAKSTAASADWGTFVWGVQLWESGTSVTGVLPAGTGVPTNYQPLDENALEGDDAITAEVNNAYAQRAGLRTLFDNDRWLAANRLRWLIGDWRHRVFKRTGFEDQELLPDPRADWTPDEWVLFGGGYSGGDKGKNITIRGDDSADDDVDAYGGSTALGGTYDQGLPETVDGDLLGPYHYPSDMQFKLHGRRLGKWSMIRPSGVRTHADDLGGLRVYMRARRLRPSLLSTDTLGFGPATEEPSYVGKGYLEFLWGSTVYKMPILPPGGGASYALGQTMPPYDVIPEWLAPIQMEHTAADQTYKVRGRLPSQPLLGSANYPAWQASHAYSVLGHLVKNGTGIYEVITTGTSAGAGGPSGTDADITDNSVHWRYRWNTTSGRPEGMLFEVELMSWCIMDEPLDASLLNAAPYA